MPSLVTSLHPAISHVRPMKSTIDSSRRTKCGFPITGNGPGSQSYPLVWSFQTNEVRRSTSV